MITIISGTNRKNANTFKIAKAYQQILNEKGASSDIIDLEKLPSDFLETALYENKGMNQDFLPFMEKMKACSKFVFIIPEYNGSFPGILKVFIDALDFPDTFKGKKSALVGLSAGIQGSALAMSHLTDIFNYLGMHVLAQKPKLMNIDKRMEGDKIVDPLTIELLEAQAEALIQF